MGLVLEAVDPVLGRRVAIKVVRPDRPQSQPLARSRLLAEARALARVSHPNVLAIHDVVETERDICLVTELIDGESAQSLQRKQHASWRDAVQLYVHVGRGLSALHAAGLVHGDVKPSNVLVGHDGSVRLADLGMATDLGEDASGGTPGFMAPEHASGQAARRALRSVLACDVSSERDRWPHSVRRLECYRAAIPTHRFAAARALAERQPRTGHLSAGSV